MTRFYINGMLDSEAAAPDPPTTSEDPVRIGSDVEWERSPAGDMDEVRIWNVARSEAQIRSTMFAPFFGTEIDGLVAAWNLNGDADDAGGVHNGTLNGAADYSAGVHDFQRVEVNCSGTLNAMDAVWILFYFADIPREMQFGCREIGA
jgi:hypothetical protein